MENLLQYFYSLLYGISYVTNTDCKQQTKDLLGVVNSERTV